MSKLAISIIIAALLLSASIVGAAWVNRFEFVATTNGAAVINKATGEVCVAGSDKCSKFGESLR